MNPNENSSITTYFSKSESISIYKNGETKTFKNGDDEFKVLLNALNEVTKNSHDMPAFGVSLNDETMHEKRNNVWIELNFNKEESFNEMPFESLLIKVQKNDQGFNLIRKYNNKYDGRCFYLNLANNMEKLYNLILLMFD